MLVQLWHGWVNQPKMSRKWHEQDVSDELRELRAADSWLDKWSETSDIVYTVNVLAGVATISSILLVVQKYLPATFICIQNTARA